MTNRMALWHLFLLSYYCLYFARNDVFISLFEVEKMKERERKIFPTQNDPDLQSSIHPSPFEINITRIHTVDIIPYDTISYSSSTAVNTLNV